MIETFTIERTGEVITADIDSVSSLTAEQLKEARRWSKINRIRYFSNPEKKRYLINKQHNNKK